MNWSQAHGCARLRVVRVDVFEMQKAPILTQPPIGHVCPNQACVSPMGGVVCLGEGVSHAY